MKKILTTFLVFIMIFLVGCSEYDNNDLSGIEAIIDTWLDENRSSDYDEFDSMDTVEAYLKNYQDLFPENVEYEGLIYSYRKIEEYDNKRILEANFIIKNIEANHLTEEMADDYVIVYEQIVKDLRKLIGDNYLYINIMFRRTDYSYVHIIHRDHPDGGFDLDIYEQQDNISLTDIDTIFKDWKKLLDIEDLNRVFIKYGENELKNLKINLFYQDDIYYFGGEDEYGLLREDVNNLILENTNGLSEGQN